MYVSEASGPLPGNHITESALSCCCLLLQLSGLRKSVQPTPLKKNVSVKDAVKQFGKKNDVSFKTKKINLNVISSNDLPIAYKQKNGGFVILARMSDDKVLIQDPKESSPTKIDSSTLDENWSGEVIRLSGPALRFDISWFLPEFFRHKRLLSEVLVFSLLLQLLALISPLFFQVVMDKVLVHNALTTLDVLVVALVAVGVFEQVLSGLREYLFIHTTNRIDIGLGVKLFRHLLGLPLLYFKGRQVGTIVTRVRELDNIRNFLTGSAMTLCVDVVFTFVFLGVMAWLSMPLTMIVLASLPLYAVVAWLTTKPLQKCIEQQFKFGAMNTSFLTESVAGVETIKSLALEPRMQRRWEFQTRDQVEANFRTQSLNSQSSSAVQLLQKVTGVLIIWVGAVQVTELNLTIGQLIAFNMMVSHVSQPVVKLVDLWRQFVQTRIAVDKLGDMLNLPVEQDQGNQRPSKPVSGDIKLVNVVFRYQPDLPPVINGLNLHIRQGESVGIIGPSGSGKSTLTRLIQKLFLAEQGDLQIDGLPIRSLSPEYLRRHIGVVLQENFLFNRTVRENISLKDPTASMDAVVRAAKLAGAHDFILGLPRGYDTVLAEGGTSLSGGQRQRIAIARALIGDPGILIFDEATSALDDESQAVIQKNMAEIAKGRTVVTIAHRLSTVRNCDRIIALEQGCIVESGTHDQLLQHGGCYARLWQLQSELKREDV